MGARHAVDLRFRGIERRPQHPVLPAPAVEGHRDGDRRLGRAGRELQPVAAEPVVAPSSVAVTPGSALSVTPM